MAMNGEFGDDVFGYGIDGALSAADEAALDHTDQLLSGLGAGARPEGRDADESEILALLGGWRAELETEPLPALPSEESVTAALSPNVVSLADRRAAGGGSRGSSRRARVLRSLTAAAAAVAVVTGGLTVASYDTQPGDALWGMHQSMFSEHAEGVQLVASLNEDLDRAELAARDGDVATAKQLLDRVSERLASVQNTEDRVSLIQRRDSIERNLDRVVPAPVTSPTSPAASPDREPPTPEDRQPADVPTTSEPSPQLTLEPAPPTPATPPTGLPDLSPLLPDEIPPLPEGLISPHGHLNESDPAPPAPSPQSQPEPDPEPTSTPSPTGDRPTDPRGPSPLTTDGTTEQTR